MRAQAQKMMVQLPASEPVEDKIQRHAKVLPQQLQAIRDKMYAPTSQKTLRHFMTHEVTKLTGISEGMLRNLSIEGKGPTPERRANNYRVYTLDQVNELRRLVAKIKPHDALRVLPHRRPGEAIQILGVINFKGGSAKTTTTAHLAHYLALQGYRVLAIDLDPQASLSVMFGVQPETEVGPNETIYAAVRYTDTPRPMREVIRKTYFPGVDLVPGNIELQEFETETPHALAKTNGSNKEALFVERLRLAIAQVEDDYDIVVLDTAPTLGFMTLAAVYAVTGLIVSVHPGMLDVLSMSQFLLMLDGLVGTIRDFGGTLSAEFFQYVITRHDPNDQAQAQVVSLLRHLFAEDVLTPTAVDSTAIELAGLAKKTVYELEVGEVSRETGKRARDSMDAVNGRILDLVWRAWGRA